MVRNRSHICISRNALLSRLYNRLINSLNSAVNQVGHTQKYTIMFTVPSWPELEHNSLIVIQFSKPRDGPYRYPCDTMNYGHKLFVSNGVETGVT